VSSSESESGRPTDVEAFKLLEGTIDSTLEEIRRLRERLASAEDQSKEMDEMLRGITDGEQSPRDMLRQLHHLEKENHELRGRLGEGMESVDRLLARVRFLEDQQ
jgi:Mg2+ and Co2+ transporter CorA